MGGTTLTEATLASHKHDIPTMWGGGSDMSVAGSENTGGRTRNTYYTGGSESHNHNLIGSTSQSSSLPLYYTLSYIMRII